MQSHLAPMMLLRLPAPFASNIRRCTAAWPLLLGVSLSAVGCGSDEGDPSSKPDAWIGNTYVLEVPEAKWTEPPGIGVEISGFVPQFLVQVQGASGSDVEVLLGTGSMAEQESCGPTQTVTASSSYPSMQIGPVDHPIYVRHATEDIEVAATAYDLTLTDVLPGGGSATGELVATMDMRELYPLFTLLITPTPETVCTALSMSSAMVPCEYCGDGEPFCLTIKAEGVVAEPSDLTVQPIDAGALDASCQ